jgi:hypothetical protein
MRVTLPEGVTADDVVDAYVNLGLNYPQVAVRLGIGDYNTVGGILRAAGVTPRRGRRPHRESGAIAAAYRAGIPSGEVAATFRCHPNTVLRHAHLAGLATAPREGRPPIPVDIGALVTAYRDEGASIRECAQRFGISPSTVTRRLRAAEVRLRPPAGGRP